jgi:hypothetical protein
MAEQHIITVHPIAGVDFRMLPEAVAVTVRYYAKMEGSPSDKAQFSNVVQAVTISLTAAQAKEIASSLERAAQMLQAHHNPSVLPDLG